MARKDEILKSFLEHEMLREKYLINENELPSTVIQALDSPIPLVNAIAKIVNSLESSTPIADAKLRELITQYLNSVAI